MDEQVAIVTSGRIQMPGVDTGAVYSAISNADALYTIPNLAIGAYRLEVADRGIAVARAFPAHTDQQKRGHDSGSKSFFHSQ
jgi:hypothetical protein